MVKRLNSPNFDFKFFESRYLDICNNGYLKKIYEFNSSKNKYIQKPKNLEDLKPFLFSFYKTKTDEFMTSLAENYEFFKSNMASRNMIYKNMEEILKYSIKFW